MGCLVIIRATNIIIIYEISVLHNLKYRQPGSYILQRYAKDLIGDNIRNRTQDSVRSKRTPNLPACGATLRFKPLSLKKNPDVKVEVSVAGIADPDGSCDDPVSGSFGKWFGIDC